MVAPYTMKCATFFNQNDFADSRKYPLDLKIFNRRKENEYYNSNGTVHLEEITGVMKGLNRRYHLVMVNHYYQENRSYCTQSIITEQ